MSIADNEIHRYWKRVYTRHHTPPDALFKIQGTMLQEILNAMELALECEEIPRAVIRRVIQKLVFGSPHMADADERIDLTAKMTDYINADTRPVVFPTAGISPYDLPPAPKSILDKP